MTDEQKQLLADTRLFLDAVANGRGHSHREQAQALLRRIDAQIASIPPLALDPEPEPAPAPEPEPKTNAKPTVKSPATSKKK